MLWNAAPEGPHPEVRVNILNLLGACREPTCANCGDALFHVHSRTCSQQGQNHWLAQFNLYYLFIIISIYKICIIAASGHTLQFHGLELHPLALLRSLRICYIPELSLLSCTQSETAGKTDFVTGSLKYGKANFKALWSLALVCWFFFPWLLALIKIQFKIMNLLCEDQGQ